jgi:hypothetical protein
MMMKHRYFLFLFALLWAVTLPAQAVLEIASEEVCWTNNGAETSLTRYVLLSSRTPNSSQVIAYVNAAGTIVDPTVGGTITLGYCGCCDNAGGGDDDWRFYYPNSPTNTNPIWRYGRVVIGNVSTPDTSHVLQLYGNFEFKPDTLYSRFAFPSLSSGANTPYYGLLFESSAGETGPSFAGGRNHFTIATSNTIFEKTRLGALAFAGNNPNDTDLKLSAFLEAAANEAWSSTSTPSNITVYTTQNSTLTPAAVASFKHDGRFQLSKYSTFSDGVPTSLIGFQTGTSHLTRHVIGGTAGAGKVPAINGAGTGLEWITPSGGGGTGTVTSVGLSMPSGFTVTGSPVTTSGTLTAAWSSQAQNSVLAGPATGGAGTPLWRALVRADLPTNVVTTLGTGTVNSVPFFSGAYELNNSPINVLNAQQVGINTTATSTTALLVSGFTNTLSNYAFRAVNSDNASIFSIENSSRIGIRTDVPTRTLDINGELRIRDLTTTPATVLVGSDDLGHISSMSITNAPFTISSGNVVSRVNQSVTTLGPGGSSLQVGIAGFTGGVYRINMSSVTSTLTLTTTGQVDGGVYTFHFINTGSKSVDFPNTFFTQTGALLDGGSTYPLPNDLFITCYSDGLNFYCK